jgi:hypothetical protein
MTDPNERFERQVADVASRVVGPERYVDALAVTRRAMDPAPRWRARITLRGLAVATASLGVLVVAALAFYGLLSTEDDGVSAPAASPSPSALAAYRFSEARPVDDDKRRFADIARLSGGATVVVGVSRRSEGGPRLPVVWASHDDGSTWTETLLPHGSSGEAVAVAARDDGFVAIVRSDNRAIDNVSSIWASADGTAWENLSTLPDALLTSIAVVPEGLAAIGIEYHEAEGYDAPAGHPTLWVSADGRAWQAHAISDPWHQPGQDPLQELSGISDLPLNFARSAAGEWMVSGPDRDVAPDSERPSVWIGAPGQAWTRVTPTVAAPGAAGRFDVIGWRPDGFVLTGETIDPNGSSYGIWITPDGTSWTQVLDLGAGAPPEVAASNDDVLAVIRPPVDWDFGGARYPVESDAYRAITDDEDPKAPRPDRLLDVAPVYLSMDGQAWSSTASDQLVGFPLGASFGGDGSLLVVGADTSACDRWWCAYEVAFGAVPTVWAGKAEPAP